MAELVDALVSGTSGSNALEVRVFLSAPHFLHCNFVWQARIGVVAQLIERYVRIVEVVGLSPISSTINSMSRQGLFLLNYSLTGGFNGFHMHYAAVCAI